MSYEEPKPDEARMSLAIPKSMRDELKIMAIKQGRTLQEIALQAFTDFMEKQEAA